MTTSIRKLNNEIAKAVWDAIGGEYIDYVTAPKQVDGINNTFDYAQRKGDTNLFDCYGSFSSAKYNAYLYCRDLCTALNGHDFYIASHNGFVFSVVFRFTHPTTGHECIAYITRDANKFCDLHSVA